MSHIEELIEQHRSAYKAWDDSIDSVEFGDDGDPKLEEKQEELYDLLLTSLPSTPKEVAALLRYIAAVEDRWSLGENNATAVMVRMAEQIQFLTA